MQPHTILQISAKLLSRFLNKRPRFSHTKQIHAQIITQSFTLTHISLTDSLIHCYIHTKNINFARTLFNNYPLPPPPTLLWNLMIRAYSKLQHSPEPINLFHQILTTQALPDDYTFTFVITSCAQQKSIVYGYIVHGMVMKNGYVSNLCVANSLINMYAVFLRVDDAYKVFDEISVRDIFSWTSLVCAYAKTGNMWRAGQVFWRMPMRNDVSWAVMVSGFTSCGMYTEALRYFHEMLGEVTPNEAVLVCALSACAHLGSLNQGNWIHDYISKNSIPETSNITTALIDMYSKCGNIDCAYHAFKKIPRPDLHNFTSMISGLSIHGLGQDAILVFHQMLSAKIKPNGITILGVLNVCSHSGLLQQGSSIFYNMESFWGIVPKIEHYGCYIDLLGRAGYLGKAFGLLKTMPVNPDIVIWRALLSACRIHRNASFGERLINGLVKLDPQNCVEIDVLLLRLYVSLGKWDKVSLMRKRKNQSDIGCSWIELNGIVHEFRVADSLHPRIIEIKEKLSEILKRVRLVGYASNSTHVSFDISEEDKEQAIAWHSEKLAIAFGLMNTPPKVSIRIVKNLRTCDDCHDFLKAISKVFDRQIIVRDRSRFHTFKEGKCSCKDYW